MTATLPERTVQTGPANSVTDQESGSRVYIHPITQERFTSVTTVLHVVGKDGLPYWAAKTVQEYAQDILPLMVKAARRKLCDTKGDDRCGICRDCVGLELRRAPERLRDEAADRGSRLHEVAEHYVLSGGEILPHGEDVAPLVAQWLAFYAQFRPEFDAAEMTVINRTHMVAGTLDSVVRLGWCPPKYRHLLGVPMVGDNKGLALTTPLPTPSGWTTMGAVRVGDQVFDVAGRPCTVTEKSEVHLKRCYRIRFDDGSDVIADHDHRWVTTHGTWAKQATSVLTTEQIAVDFTPGALARRHRISHRISLAGALELPEAPLPIHPYVLGCWLGDGNTSGGVISKPDDDLFDEIERCGFKVGPNQSATGRCPTRTVYGLRTALRLAGLLGHKQVPDVYLRGSASQRLALLQGLMDTDGCWASLRGQAVFQCTDKGLSLAVRELAHSLGQRTSLWEGSATGFGKTVQVWRVAFTPIGINPFRLPRKANGVPTQPGSRVKKHRLVVAVESTLTVPTQCIAVDSPSHTYLCGEQMVPTHNTGKGVYPEFALQLAAYRHADAVLLPDGREIPLPEMADTGVLLHFRPDNYWVRPVDVSRKTFDVFLRVLDFYRWLHDSEESLISRAMYKPPNATPIAATQVSTDPVERIAQMSPTTPAIPF